MNRHEIREELGYTDKDFIIIYVAEFIERKNKIHKKLKNILT